MRIVVTLPWGERLGGAEAMIQAVLDGAREAGHELELVFLREGPWLEELRSAGFRVQALPAGRLRDLHRWPMTIWRLARLLRRRRPDLILNWAAKTQLYGAPAAVLAGMSERVVWWQQNIPDGDWIDRCATALPARAIGCYSQVAASAQARLWPMRHTFVVAAGARQAGNRGVRAHGAMDRSRAAASRSGVRVELPLQLPPDTPVVGIVGRLQPWKGQHRLLEAHALLRSRGRRLHTVVVGGDAYGLSPEYAASLPALIERLGLAEEVTMTGQLPDAGPCIEQMDVLVNASDPEPFGIVLLEAMARGVAVVAVDSGGPSEFVEHGETGMLAVSGQPPALADALEPLLDSAELRARIARAGRERFLRDFTDVALRRRFFAQLESLVGQPTGSAATRA